MPNSRFIYSIRTNSEGETLPIPIKLKAKYTGSAVARRTQKSHSGQVYGSLRKKAKRFPGFVSAAKLGEARRSIKYARKRARPSKSGL